MNKYMQIRYIGRRQVYTDNIYKTGLTWKKGTVHDVPVREGMLIAKHKDVFEVVDNGDTRDTMSPETTVIDVVEDENIKEENDIDSEESEIARASVMQMNRKAALVDFARNNFSVDLEVKQQTTVNDLREQCLNLIDQYGLPE